MNLDHFHKNILHIKYISIYNSLLIVVLFSTSVSDVEIGTDIIEYDPFISSHFSLLQIELRYLYIFNSWYKKD